MEKKRRKEKRKDHDSHEVLYFSHTVFDFLYSTRINDFCHVVAPPKNESFIGQSTKMSCNYLLATEIMILRQKVMFSRVFLCLLSKFVILFFLAKNHITHGFLVLVEEQRCGSQLERGLFFQVTMKRVLKNCAQFHELPKNLLTLNYISAQNQKLAHKIINFAHTLIFTLYLKVGYVQVIVFVVHTEN